MARQAQLFFTAIQFLTRLPIPQPADCGPDALARAAKYFPLAGQIVGALSGAVLLLVSCVFDGALPALLAVGTGIVVTGALHEDGLADTADGLGGGRDKTHRLAIMKDSRIGVYGVIAVVLCIAIKVAALANIASAWTAAAILLAAHGGARATATTTMALQIYAGDPDAAKVRSSTYAVTRAEMRIAIVLALWPLLLMPFSAALVGTLTGCVAASVPALKARKLLNGFTGDILGAIEQAFEAGFLVGAAAMLHG